MRELKKRVGEVERKKRLGDALQSLDTSAMMDSFNHLVDQVKEKAAVSQAKIELMLEQDEADEAYRNEEDLRREEARKLINDLKKATETADFEHSSDTRESNSTEQSEAGKDDEDASAGASKEVKKTIGPKK